MTLKLGQGQQFCSYIVARAKIFGYTKFCLATLKTVSEVDPRLEKKKRKFLVSEALRSTTSGKYPVGSTVGKLLAWRHTMVDACDHQARLGGKCIHVDFSDISPTLNYESQTPLTRCWWSQSRIWFILQPSVWNINARHISNILNITIDKRYLEETKGLNALRLNWFYSAQTLIGVRHRMNALWMQIEFQGKLKNSMQSIYISAI